LQFPFVWKELNETVIPQKFDHLDKEFGQDPLREWQAWLPGLCDPAFHNSSRARISGGFVVPINGNAEWPVACQSFDLAEL
jgi:hypothetical protein